MSSIAITAGDPAGIGPEIAAAAAADPRVLDVCEPIVYAPPDLQRFAAGVLSGEAGRAAYEAIVRAVDDARQRRVDGIATAPVNKEAFRLAGLPWSGHTDLLAHLTGATHVAMMFHSPALRVVLATVHIALADVPRALTQPSLEATITLTARELPRYGVASPRIAVAGLNPHAGEHGLFGREEETVIAPAIAACRARGIDVVRTVSRRYRVPPRPPRRIRRRRRVLSRPGIDPGQTPRLWRGGERDAGSPDRADVGRSRHGVRHCGQGSREPGKHDRGGSAGGEIGGREGARLATGRQ